MIEKGSDINIQDNCFADEDFCKIKELITSKDFPWYFNPTTVREEMEHKDALETSPGLFVHMAYYNNVPTSEFFQSCLPILDQLNCSVLTRIKLNLQTRLPKPDYAAFHSDTEHLGKMVVREQWTTSILYINTNNGYTEIGVGGRLVNSVANRLVSFPSHLQHRAVSQTDTQRRIVVNFNYLKNTNPI